MRKKLLEIKVQQLENDVDVLFGWLLALSKHLKIKIENNYDDFIIEEDRDEKN